MARSSECTEQYAQKVFDRDPHCQRHLFSTVKELGHNYGVIAQVVGHFSRCTRLVIASLFLRPPLLCSSQSQPHSIVCSAGTGNFDAGFPTGVKVHVGATRNGGLATRACTANLNWGNQALVVAESASQVDLDAFGVDLGDGIQWLLSR